MLTPNSKFSVSFSATNDTCTAEELEFLVCQVEQSVNVFPKMKSLLSEAAELLDQFDNGLDSLTHATKIRDFLATLQ